MNLLLWGSSSVKITSAFWRTGRHTALVLKQSLVSHVSCSASNYPLFRLSPLSSLSPSPALWDGCMKVALRQIDRGLKTKQVGRGSPSPVTNPMLREKACHFPGGWEHAVLMSLQGNAVVTQQHGPFWLHGDSSGCTDAGSGISCMPSCPKSSPESHGYCHWWNTKPLICCPSPCSCKLLPCSEFRMKYCIYSVYKMTINYMIHWQCCGFITAG